MRIRRGLIGMTIGVLCVSTLAGCRSATSPDSGVASATSKDDNRTTTTVTEATPSDRAPTESASNQRTRDREPSDEERPNEEIPSTTIPESTRTDPAQTTPTQTDPDQTRPNDTPTPNQTGLDQTTPNQTSLDETAPNQTTPNQTTPNQTTPKESSISTESSIDTGSIDTGNSFAFESASSVALARPAAPEPDEAPKFAFEIGAAESPIAEELRSDPLYYTRTRNVDCPPDIASDSISCQEVTLPEDYDTPDNGRSVTLMVATVDNGDPLGIGPVVYLQGGPGVGVVDNARTYVGSNFDIILVDQRGTGRSEPLLDCTEQVETYPSLMSLESRSGRAARLDASAESGCIDRLNAANVNLDSFRSENNAEDIALLRRVLGYEQWNLFGSSYGTRLALTVVRDHPEGVRSVVLDAVLPPEADFFGRLGENYLRALDELNQACRDDVVCEQNYGDLREAVDVAAALLDYSPVTVRVERPISGDTIDVVVDGPRLHSFIFDRLYSTTSLSELPAAIHAATTGDVGTLTWRSVVGSDPEGFAFSEAMYWSVMCAEEVPYIDLNADKRLAAQADDSIVYAFATSAFRDTCTRFDVKKAPLIENRPVRTDVPILAATGSFDPVTPPEWGRELGDRLPNATFVEFTSRAHGAASSCFMTLTNAFFSDPTAPIDAGCAAEAPIVFE